MFARLFERFGSYVCGGLLVALVVTTTGWYISDARLDACKAGRKADRAAYEKAQSDAEILWMKAIKKKEQEYEQQAKKADEAYDALAGKYNDAIRVYVDAQSKARRAIASAQGGSPESSDGPGKNPFIPDEAYVQPELDITQVVVVPVSDLAMCAENTARLVVARDWALGLNK
jgi:hypothetical protein